MWGRRIGLVQSEIDALSERVTLARLDERISALDRLMEAKFVTVDAMVRFQADKVALALTAAQTAIDKAEIADEKSRDRLADDMKNRFESVNEFRGQQKDIISTFMPRGEFDQFRDRHTQELSELKERIDKAEGRQGGVANVWGVIVAVAGIAIAIGALVFRNM